jgi:hypothetical protein
MRQTTARPKKIRVPATAEGANWDRAVEKTVNKITHTTAATDCLRSKARRRTSGGHTFAVVSNTMNRLDELKAIDGWVEPFVRVRFITSKAAFVVPEEMVEALSIMAMLQQLLTTLLC